MSFDAFGLRLHWADGSNWARLPKIEGDYISSKSGGRCSVRRVGHEFVLRNSAGDESAAKVIGLKRLDDLLLPSFTGIPIFETAWGPANVGDWTLQFEDDFWTRIIDISGSWVSMSDHRIMQVDQDGDALTIRSGDGLVVPASMRGNGFLQTALGPAEIEPMFINWPNNKWTRNDVSGFWHDGTRFLSARQVGNAVCVVDDVGKVTTGHMVDGNVLKFHAMNHHGAHKATNIDWSDGSKWQRSFVQTAELDRQTLRMSGSLDGTAARRTTVLQITRCHMEHLVNIHMYCLDFVLDSAKCIALASSPLPYLSYLMCPKAMFSGYFCVNSIALYLNQCVQDDFNRARENSRGSGKGEGSLDFGRPGGGGGDRGGGGGGDRGGGGGGDGGGGGGGGLDVG